MPQPTLPMEDTADTTSNQKPVLLVAFELSSKEWRLALVPGDGMKARHEVIPAGDLEKLAQVIEAARERFELPQTAKVVSCYEAGRDGFWLHRLLVGEGIENSVIDSSSILVDRRQRRAKTDSLDALQLLELLCASRQGRATWRTVVVPPEEVEDGRRLHRERERLVKERTSHRNRITSLLVLHGIQVSSTALPEPEDCVTAEGAPLPPATAAELGRELERLALVQKQILEIQKQRQLTIQAAVAELAAREPQPAEPARALPRMVATLMQLRAVGPESAWILGYEFFGWRTFANRRQVASAAGLAPVPFNSGTSQREQGISKAGNKRVRKLLIELAWSWLRYQPESASSVWFKSRFGSNGKRNRRVGIVALARRILVDLWRFAAQGVLPDGATLKSDLAPR